jgi:hypothetical protein
MLVAQPTRNLGPIVKTGFWVQPSVKSTSPDFAEPITSVLKRAKTNEASEVTGLCQFGMTQLREPGPNFVEDGFHNIISRTERGGLPWI